MLQFAVLQFCGVFQVMAMCSCLPCASFEALQTHCGSIQVAYLILLSCGTASECSPGFSASSILVPEADNIQVLLSSSVPEENDFIPEIVEENGALPHWKWEIEGRGIQKFLLSSPRAERKIPFMALRFWSLSKTTSHIGE